jgi:hypothetical protein
VIRIICLQGEIRLTAKKSHHPQKIIYNLSMAGGYESVEVMT